MKNKSIKFETQKTIQYWNKSAIYDLNTGKTLIKTRRFPYALFFGHLALEKILKAIVVKNTHNHAPYTHSLPVLLERANIKIPREYVISLREFMEFHIESRYPDEQKFFYKKCTESYTKAKFKEI